MLCFRIDESQQKVGGCKKSVQVEVLRRGRAFYQPCVDFFIVDSLLVGLIETVSYDDDDSDSLMKLPWGLVLAKPTHFPSTKCRRQVVF